MGGCGSGAGTRRGARTSRGGSAALHPSSPGRRSQPKPGHIPIILLHTGGPRASAALREVRGEGWEAGDAGLVLSPCDLLLLLLLPRSCERRPQSRRLAGLFLSARVSPRGWGERGFGVLGPPLGASSTQKGLPSPADSLPSHRPRAPEQRWVLGRGTKGAEPQPGPPLPPGILVHHGRSSFSCQPPGFSSPS